MKIQNYIFLVMVANLSLLRADLLLLDKIQCVVCGPVKNSPLAETDETFKKNMDNQLVPLGLQIQNVIVDQQIIEDKVPIDPTAADKYIDTLKRQNNLTDQQLHELFADIGRTPAEGIALLTEQYNHEMFMYYKFKSQQIITDDMIKEYYDENPIWVDAALELEIAYVDFNAHNKDTIKKSLEALQAGDAQAYSVSWSAPMVIMKQDISEDKSFLFDLQPGVMHIVEDANSFELYRVVSKEDAHVKSLDERRSAINDKLTRKKMEQLLEKYNADVSTFVDIIDLVNT